MPSTHIRQTVLAAARRVVVKIGTQVLTKPQPPAGVDVAYLRHIAKQVVTLKKQGMEVTLVSSGAVGAGCVELGLPRRPKDVADLQAVAAVGQRRLMTHLHDVFARQGFQVGQVLLTRGDFDDRVRFLNLRNCITRLHKLGCIPILNENDSVAVDELRFGDNDLLAAMTCNALRADVLVLLTVVDGLLDERGRRIDLVHSVDEAMGLVKAEKSHLGRGGMAGKLEAAKRVTRAGEVAVIAHGRAPNVLVRLFEADRLGTLFVPSGRKLDSRRRWIGLTKRPAGVITIDAGAVAAVTQRGKSLLASGITHTLGRYEGGQVVKVQDTHGGEIARGLCNYSAQEVRAIMGKRSSQFEKVLGRPAYAEVIHRDNLVLTNP